MIAVLYAYVLSFPMYSSWPASGIYLSNFRTFTVQVETEKGLPLRDIVGHDADELSDLVLKKLSARVNEKWKSEKILSSRFGAPYSFKTNPMNVAIVFYFVRDDKNPKVIRLQEVGLRRSLFFKFYRSNHPQDREAYTKMGRERAESLIEQHTSISLISNVQRSYIANWEDVDFVFDAYAKAIVEKMEPNMPDATKAEEYVGRILRPN